MATDLQAIVANLVAFHDLAGQRVVEVGAGGGQFVPYLAGAARVLAVDPDPAALARLREVVAKAGLADRYAFAAGAFEDVSEPADVVFFEFCLHEIEDPAAALRHAHALAPRIVVIDHLPGSAWAWHTLETEKAQRAWTALEAHGIARRITHRGVQVFADRAALEDKVRVQGEDALRRAATLPEAGPLTIAMDYGIALL